MLAWLVLTGPDTASAPAAAAAAAPPPAAAAAPAEPPPMLSCASVAVSDWLLLLGLCWPTRSCSGSSGLPWWWWLPRTTAGEEGRGRGHKEDGECGGLESQPSKFCGAQELPWASSVAGTHDTAHGRACICYGSCEECGLLCCGCSTASPRQLARGGGGGFGGGGPPHDGCAGRCCKASVLAIAAASGWQQPQAHSQPLPRLAWASLHPARM